MNCEDVRKQFPDYWSGALDHTARGEMQSHLEICSSCREEAESLSAVWKRLGAIPEEKPGQELRARFEATLEAYLQGLGHRTPPLRERVEKWLQGWWPQQPAFQFAFAVAFLAIGFLLGHSYVPPAREANHDSVEVARLREEVQATRQLVTLSLLQQQSASERLRGVDYSSRLRQPDPEVLSALLHTVDYDQNVNVRLAAIDALHQSSGSDVVRKGLIQALGRQNSPLVQIALIDMLVEIHSRESAQALRQLMDDNSANQIARQRAEWGLQQLR